MISKSARTPGDAAPDGGLTHRASAGIAVVLAACLAVGGMVSAVPVAQAAEKAATLKDLERVRERIQRLERGLRQDAGRRGELEQALREAETAAAGARQTLREIRGRRAGLEAARSTLQQKLDEEEAASARQKEALAAQLRAMYMYGPGEPLRVVLSQQDASLLSRRLAWSGYLARDRRDVLAALDTSLRALAASRRALEQQVAEIHRLEAEQSRSVDALDRSRRQRAGVIAKLDAENRGRESELRQARDQAGRLEKLVRELERTLSRAASRAPSTGPLTGDGRWPVAGRFLAEYGQPRAGGQLKWDGVLIAAPAGTDVKAARDGRVVYADWLPGLGLLLVVEHGGGYMSLYGHNQDLLRKVGDRVRSGEAIARVGDTGGQGRSALYFEVRRNGRPENPGRWVR